MINFSLKQLHRALFALVLLFEPGKVGLENLKMLFAILNLLFVGENLLFCEKKGVSLRLGKLINVIIVLNRLQPLEQAFGSLASLGDVLHIEIWIILLGFEQMIHNIRAKRLRVKIAQRFSKLVVPKHA